MAENPGVDGIRNIAIQDEKHGVFMQGHTVLGSLFGIKAKVSGYADLSGMNVSGDANLSGMNVSGDADLSGMNVSGNAYLRDMNVSGDAYLIDMNVSGNAYLSGMNVKRLILTRTKPTSIEGLLELSGTVIEDLDIKGEGNDLPLIVGTYKIDDKTKVPESLTKILSNYRRVE